jgi:Lectin C-type domain/Leucine Rich repeats (2 copies)
MSSATVPVVLNPFPGLRPFREDEEHLFFGRESQVDTMIDKLARTHFLAVVGTSGSGKSSLVNSGLRPALHRGLMTKAGTSWRVAQFRPGGHPVRAMARSLADKGVLFGDYASEGLSLAAIIEATLNLSKLGLADIYEQAQPGADVNLLVVVDQFEELFRYRQMKAAVANGEQNKSQEASAFVNLLLEARAQVRFPIYLVLTMRSDFLGDCAQFSGLAEAINEGQYLVPRLTREERKAAIAGPVGVGGGRISPVLLTRLINDVGDNPDQLSILQHALNRTWSHWQSDGGDEGPISLPHYEAIGTMTHALDLHAEKAYADLAVGRRQQICEKVFKALTDASDGRGIRRPTSLATLCALAEANQAELIEVMSVFRKPSRSFVMPPLSETLEPDTVMDISHESLMRVWVRLKVWAAEEAQSAHRYRRLSETAVEHAAKKADLLRDPELRLALDWREKTKPNAAWASLCGGDFEAAMRFLSDSEREAANARKLARIKLVRRYIGAVLAFAALLGVGFFVSTEMRKRSGNWTEAFKVDFTQPPPVGRRPVGPAPVDPPPDLSAWTTWLEDNLEFRNPEGTEGTAPWQIVHGAMWMKPQEWCWLKKVQISSDTKVVVHLRFTDAEEAFQVCINAKKKLRQRNNNPPGYSCRFGIWGGAMNLITGDGLDRENDFNSLSLVQGGGGSGDFWLTFMRQGEDVSLEVKKGGKILYSQQEAFLLPLVGEHDAQGGRNRYYENVGIRTWGKDVEVLSIEADRFKLPEEASPTVAGDALAEAGYLDEAIKKYKAIATDYQHSSSSIYALALTKGYLLADHPEDADSRGFCRQRLKSLDKHIRSHRLDSWFHPGQSAESTRYLNSFQEVETLGRWKNSDERVQLEALKNFPAIFEANPKTQIVGECLKAEHKILTPKVSEELLRRVAKTPGIVGLDISSFGMTNLGALAAVRSLRGLDCRNNQLTGLDPLRSMDQLRALYCGQNPIGTLESIRALKLIELSCDDNQLENLEPLSSMQLGTLYCSENRIKDLSPLKGMPIYALDCSHNNIGWLDPISDLPVLIELYCGSNQIRSIEPLRRAKTLQYLDCSSNAIQTLEPLKELKLASLDCSGNPIGTLEPFVAEDPPPTFVFDDCEMLPETEIERAINVWESKKSLRWNVSYGKFALARKRGDAQVKELAQSGAAGHRYLFVQKYLTADQAKKFCKRLGGHLVTITSEAENEFLKAIPPPDASCRIGIEVSEGKPRWVSGEGTDTEFVSAALTDFRPTDKIVTWKNGSWLPSQEDKPMPFIVEWDPN